MTLSQRNLLMQLQPIKDSVSAKFIFCLVLVADLSGKPSWREGFVVAMVLGGIGVARLTPTAQFTYSSGPLPDGSTPSVGDDVTSQIVSAGDFTAPGATTAFMYTLGAGVEIPVTRQWAVDAGYRFSRVAADTPVNAQGVTFGIGYRF